MRLIFENDKNLQEDLLFQSEFNKLKVETGDIIVTSSNSFMGSIVKMFTSSKMTHVGIIINYDKEGNIIFGNSNDIFITLILECIAESKYNWLTKKISNGVGLYGFSNSAKQLNLLKRSKKEFKERLNSEDIYKFINEFIEKPISNYIKFVAIWLGFFIDKDSEIICSEFCYKFIEKFMVKNDKNIKHHSMVHPRYFTDKNTVVHNNREIIYNNTDYYNAIYLLLIVFGVFFIISIILLCIPCIIKKIYIKN